jgi:hypothetical protein
MLESSAHRVALLVGAMAALGGAGVASAQAVPAAGTLTWRAPPGCPTEATVAAEVGQNLAGSGAGSTAFTAVVDVRGPTEDGRWEASLLFQALDTRAERRFEAESCEAIASAAALVIALWAEGWVDAPPAVTVAPAPFVPPPAPVAAVPAVIAASRAAVREDPLADARRRQLVFMLNGLLDSDTMPGTAARGIELGGGLLWKGQGWRLRALAGGSYFPMRLWNLPNNVRLANSQLWNVASRGCFTFGDHRFEFGPCAGVELAFMRETGEPFTDSNQLWLSLLGAAVASVRIWSPVALFMRGEAVVPTTRPRYFVNDPGDVWEAFQVPALAFRGALGIEMSFW